MISVLARGVILNDNAMNNMITFSVIIPVFNVESCLSTCIDSILPALNNGDEVLLSLGKSTDNSNIIAKNYAETHGCVKIIMQSGTGLSNARNTAFKQAVGDYIIYIDSDDFVDTVAFTAALNEIRTHDEYDVFAFDFFRYDRKTKKALPFFQIGEGNAFEGIELFPNTLSKGQAFWNVWRFVFRREFLIEKGILFKENYNAEDVDYATNFLLAEPAIKFIHNPYYFYTVGRGSSLMDCPTYKRLSDTTHILEDSIRRCREHELEYVKSMLARYQFEYILVMALIWEMPEDQRKQCIDLFRNWREVLIPSSDRTVHISGVLISAFGIYGVAFLLQILKKIRRKIRKIRRGQYSDYYKNPVSY